MQRLMERFGDKALLRFLQPQEIELVKNYKTAAGFWAAKEAFSKALGVGIGSECSFYDMLLEKTPKGAPILIPSQKIVDSFSIKNTSISITHDGEYAVAVAVIEISTTSNKIK